MSSRWAWLARAKSVVVAVALLVALFVVPLSAYALSADGFEPDASAAEANPIATDGSAQVHSIYPAGEQDWVSFEAVEGRQYAVATNATGGGVSFDSYIHLYDTDGTTHLTSDDDGGPGLWSYIEWTAPASGTYYIKVRGYSTSSNGDYALTVTELLNTLVEGQVVALDSPFEMTGQVALYRDMSGYYDYYSSVFVGADGVFSAAHMPPGNYKFEFTNGFPYLSEFFEDAYSLEDATPVGVVEGSPAYVSMEVDWERPGVAGTVTEADTGDPLTDVEVGVFGWNADFSTYDFLGSDYVDGNGQYRFWLEAGDYKLGFYNYSWDLLQYWGGVADIADSAPINIVPGTTFTADETMDLPQASIAGTVSDEQSGEPLYEAYVEVFRDLGDGDYEYWDYTYTNEFGEYEFWMLPDGPYKVFFSNGEGYFAEFHDDKTSIYSGDTVVVDEHATARVDAWLTQRSELGPDMFEPDDSRMQAPLIDPDGGSSLHTIYADNEWPWNDNDWVKFQVTAGYIYTASAEPLLGEDMYLWVDALDGDGAYIGGSSFVAEEDGYAYFRVSSEYGMGFYKLTVFGQEPAAITGTVTSKTTGDPIEGVEAVRLQRYSDYWGDYYDWVEGDVTDSEGAYSFNAVPPGSENKILFATWGIQEYASEWYDDQRTMEQATVIQPVGGESVIADAELAEAATIEGLITDEKTGLPVAYAEVTVWEYVNGDGPEPGFSGYWPVAGGQADALGSYSVGGLSAGTYRVQYSAEGYSSEFFDNQTWVEDASDIVVGEGDTESVDVQLGVGAGNSSIRGTVTDRATGAPISGVEVKAMPFTTQSGYWLPMGFSSYRSWTGSDGTYRLGPISATDFSGYGEIKWKISFVDEMSGYLPQFFDDVANSEEATLVPLPDNDFFEANAALDTNPNVGTITGRITDAETGEPVRYGWVHTHVMSGYEFSSYYADADEEGYYTLRGLLPGVNFTLHAGGYNQETEEEYLDEFYENKRWAEEADVFTLSPGETRTADFQLSMPVSLTGTVLRDDTDDPAKGVQVELYELVPEMSSSYMTSGYSGYLPGGLQSGYMLRWWDGTRTDRDGKYEFGWLDPARQFYLLFQDDEMGLYQSEWYDDALNVVDADQLVLSPGMNVADASLGRNQSFGSIEGSVSDSYTEMPVYGAQVDLYYAPSSSGYAPTFVGPETSFFGRTHTMPDGSYRFDGLMPTEDGYEYYVMFSDVFGRYYSEWYDGAGTLAEATPISVPRAASANVGATLVESQAPEVSAIVASTYEGLAHFTISATDNGPAGVSYVGYWVDGGETVEVAGDTANVAVSGIGYHEVYYFAVDNAGNYSDLGWAEFDIVEDFVPPTTTAEATPEGLAEDWHPAPTTVTLTPEDNSGEVDVTYYRIGEEGFTTYNAPFEVPTGESVVEFYSVDTDSNTEDVQSITVKSDGDMPTTEAAVESVETTSVDWRSAPTTVTLTAEDATSGVYRTYYKFGDGEAQLYEGPFHAPAGETTIHFWSVDKAGNAEEHDMVVTKVDTEAPETGLSYDNVSGKWAASPAHVELDATDFGSGVDSTEYDLGSGFVNGTTFQIAANEGSATAFDVSYRSTDKLGNVEDTNVSQVWIDNADPSTPAKPWWSGVTTATVELDWSASSDDGAGVAAYKVYKDNVLYQTVTGTSLDITGLSAGTTYTFRIVAVDGVGNMSGMSPALSVKTPQLSLSGDADVTETGTTTETVTVGGQDYTVVFENVTTPGELNVSVTSDPPAGAQTGFRFLGLHFDVEFDGVLAPGSDITITLPYDPAIPDARVLAAKIKHWTGGAWVNVDLDSVDLVNHTVTFTVDSLSPFSITESDTVDMSTSMRAGFGTATRTAVRVVNYGQSSVLVGKLKDAGGAGLTDKTVNAEYYNTSLMAWIKMGTATPGFTAGEYRYTISSTRSKTLYRLSFAGDAYNTASASGYLVVNPRVKLSTPKAPSSASLNTAFKMSGLIYPKHKAGSTKTVYLRCYRLESGKWKLRKTVATKITNRNSYSSNWVGSVRLGYRGKWKVAAYAPTDAGHYKTMSGPSKVFSVK